MKKFTLCVLLFQLLVLTCNIASAAIEAEKDAPIMVPYDQRLQRVEALESQIVNMKVRADHPRIFVNAEILPSLKANSGQAAYVNVIKKADKGDYMNSAMAYLLTGEQKYSQAVYNYIMARANETDPAKPHYVVWSFLPTNPDGTKAKEPSVFNQQDVSCACMAFDWAYNGLTDQQRKEIIEKLSYFSEIAQKYQAAQNGYRRTGETFHREEWAFYTDSLWCEIALAKHDPDAEAFYKREWGQDWYFGDALRAAAYTADGTQYEGYYRGNDGIGAFLPLYTATGIDAGVNWATNAAKHLLYRLDVDNKREIFHHGVATAANVSSYNPAVTDLWKPREYLGQNLGFLQDPYAKGIIDSLNIKPSAWIISNAYYSSLVKADVKDIAALLYYDETISAKSVKEISPNKYFPDGNELYLGTGWSSNDTRAFFRTTPMYTMTSHGDFDVNSWGVYKNGQMLSGDTGFYDAYEGQTHYFAYQKMTVAHNDLLFIDPAKPDEPIKLSGRADPGGVIFGSTKSFSWNIKPQAAFVHHNPSADWSDISFYEEGPGYVYAVGSAAGAYVPRATKYNRHFMWIPDGDNAWIVIYDDLEYQQGLIVKDLIHSVTQPETEGASSASEEVPGHIFTKATNKLISTTFDGSARMTTNILLPRNANVRFIGGDGYEYWVDGTKPQNFPVNTTKASAEKWSGLPWQNMGTWRAEIIGQGGDFFKIVYISDEGETIPEVSYKDENGNPVAVFGGHSVVFNGERLALANIVSTPLPEPPPPEPSPTPEPQPDPIPAPPVCPPQQECEVCGQCPPFVAKEVLSLSQFGTVKSAMYDRMDQGEILRYFHSTRKKIYRCQVE